jgi:hypothetical protein
MRYVNSAVANCDHAQNQATYCTCEVTEWQNKRNQKIPGTLSNPGNPLDFWYKGIMSPDRMSRDRMSCDKMLPCQKCCRAENVAV